VSECEISIMRKPWPTRAVGLVGSGGGEGRGLQQSWISVEVLSNYERLSIRWSRILSSYTKLEVNNGVKNWTIFHS